MRILYAAMKYDYGNKAQGLSFEHNNFFDCLSRLGHDIIYFDFATLMASHGRAKMNQLLAEIAAAEKPDLTFVILTGEEFEKETISRISASGSAPTLAWFSDDHWRFDNYSRYWAPCFNWSVTTARSALPKYQAAGIKNVIKSQWACNPFQYRKLDLPLKYDATFVGQPHGDRRYMVKRLRDAGIDVRCWGTGWESGRLTQSEMIEVFNQSRINLNFSNASTTGGGSNLRARAKRLAATALNYIPFGRALKSARRQKIVARETEAPAAVTLQPQIKGRNFEVPGCGGLMLSGQAEDLSSYYDIGSEIVCFDGIDDLIERCKVLLGDEAARAQIADAGLKRTLREHTYAHRFADIFRTMGLPAGADVSPTPGQLLEIT